MTTSRAATFALVALGFFAAFGAAGAEVASDPTPPAAVGIAPRLTGNSTYNETAGTCQGTAGISIPEIPPNVQSVRVRVFYNGCVGTIEDVSYDLEDALPAMPLAGGSGAVEAACEYVYQWYVGVSRGTLHMISGSGAETWTVHHNEFQWNPCEPQMYGLGYGGHCTYVWPWICDRYHGVAWDQRHGTWVGSHGSADYHARVWPADYHTDLVAAGASKRAGAWGGGAYCEQSGDLPWVRWTECLWDGWNR